MLEFAGIGPAPFCAMLLVDMGADVLRIDRPGHSPRDLTSRGRRSLVLDLKSPSAIETCLSIVEKADVLIEGFRPGVMERLGLGPDVVTARNPAIIYGRMTGWGQTGPLARAAGHDINYISLAGVQASIGTLDDPVPPLNLVGDYGGGSLYLALGVVAALYERTRSGQGQIIDAAVVDGAASLMTVFMDPKAAGLASAKRAENMLAGAAPFYGIYRCGDGEFISIGAIEPQFYALFHEKLGIPPGALGQQLDPADWQIGRRKLAAIFAGRTRAEWCALLEGTDVCFAPVLDPVEAPTHPHMKLRRVFVEIDGVFCPAPAPRFSRTPSASNVHIAKAGEGGTDALREWGVPSR